MSHNLTAATLEAVERQLRELCSSGAALFTPASGEFSELPGVSAAVLRGEALDLTTKAGRAKREELLRALADGELVELEIDVRAFEQIPGVANRNHLRFKPSILRKLAKSFAQMPYLRDHLQGDSTARGGTILKSKATPLENGGVGFDMTVLVTSPTAVEMILRGNADRFSIGWSFPTMRSILCSACESPIYTDCYHFPGRVLVDDDGNETVVEWVFTEATGVELSNVSVPAVVGTRIDEIRSALSATAATFAAHAREQREERMSLKEIAQTLGLSPDAGAPEIKAAIEARNAAGDVTSTTVAEAEARIAALEAENEVLRVSAVDQLFAEFADRIPKHRDAEGKPATHPVEVKLRALCGHKGGIESARGILESMPKRVGPGGPVSELQSLQTDHMQPVADDHRPAALGTNIPWNPVLANQLAQLGISPEEYAEFGPHNNAKHRS